MLLFGVVLVWLCQNNIAQNNYFIDSRINCNNVYNAVNNPNESTEWIRFLGVFGSTNDCIESCLKTSTINNRCESYTYYTSIYNDNSFASHCYGRFGSPYGLLWIPIDSNQVNCGRIIYKCLSDIDCEFNGQCNINTGNCSCYTAWSGYHCQELNLLKATKGNGYHIINDNNSNEPTSSWGGSVLIDKTDNNDSTKYHMFLSEFDNHCGLNSWHLNSRVIHAQSSNGYNSEFERVEVIHQHFGHEPDAIYGPNGEIIIYYEAYNFTGNNNECECEDGSTPPSCNTPTYGSFINIMDYSPSGSPNGPWIRSVIFPNKSTYGNDTNLAGIITKNGTFIGFRRYIIQNQGSEIHLVLNTNWKNSTNYMIEKELIFPQLTPLLTEDPFIYIDCNGYYHAIWHNMSPNNLQTHCGGHSYSINGIDWIYAGSSYGNTVYFTDNTNITFSRRERPHFIFDNDDCTPIALTNGVQYGGKYGDATYTLLQPVAH